MAIVRFIKDEPALLIEREGLLVVGDLHIGRDITLRKSGIYVANSTERQARRLLELCRKERAKGLVLLGDVKESIYHPQKEEFEELMSFFYILREVRIIITKGNHDSRIGDIIKRINANAQVVNELLLDKVALMHGNKLPSAEAVQKDYLIIGHSHPAIDIHGKYEKAWVASKAGKGIAEKYKIFNKKIKLIIAPAFNDLITGSGFEDIEKFGPLFRNRIFELRKSDFRPVF